MTTNKKTSLSFLAIIFILFLFSNNLNLDIGIIVDGGKNSKDFIQEALPLDMSIFNAQPYPECEKKIPFFCSVAWLGISETFQMAYIATILGFLLAIPFSVFASSNLDFGKLKFLSRSILSFVRVLPSLVWAIFFVVAVGLGPLAGVLAMTLYTVGFLGKLQYETFEGISNHPIESAKALGMKKWQIVRHVVFPESANSMMSQLLFMLEYNIRHGAIIGLVGAGGIGYYLNLYLKLGIYDRVLSILIVMFISVMLIDSISTRLRKKYFADQSSRAGLSTPTLAALKKYQNISIYFNIGCILKYSINFY